MSVFLTLSNTLSPSWVSSANPLQGESEEESSRSSRDVREGSEGEKVSPLGERRDAVKV